MTGLTRCLFAAAAFASTGLCTLALIPDTSPAAAIESRFPQPSEMFSRALSASAGATAKGDRLRQAEPCDVQTVAHRAIACFSTGKTRPPVRRVTVERQLSSDSSALVLAPEPAAVLAPAHG
jgi:hypothetical protein